ncbi:MAG: hypothetical protein G3W59_21325, partial [Xanthomonas perforans]|nr:hypothetical protein [Xanthomonas perforans]
MNSSSITTIAPPSGLSAMSSTASSAHTATAGQALRREAARLLRQLLRNPL